MKRLRWFVAGAVSVIAGGRMARRKLHEVAERNAPVAIARRQAHHARHRLTQISRRAHRSRAVSVIEGHHPKRGNLR